MNQFIYRILFAFSLQLMLLTSCAAEQLPPAEEPEEEVIARFNDVPPTVDPARRYQLPVNTRIGLAGNYGELRPDHFHGGLDFKTDQTTGHPVFAFADGFVRRAAINAHGYGLVLYVEHPSLGLTSVYGHLEGFNETIWAKIREIQVRDELNNASLHFEPEDLPVKQGEVIALSGNTGSSGGPHVHFELRNGCMDDDIYYDPQMFFLDQIRDTQAPRIHNLYLYPQEGAGLANGQTSRQMSVVQGVCATRGGKGGSLAQPFDAWGRVGLGLKAYDYMDGYPNKDGVKEVRLYEEVADSLTGENRWKMIYHFRQDAFRYSEQRYTNSVTDYAAWVGERSLIMKSFVEPGNHLQQVADSLGDGIINFDEERPYKFRYELQDAHRNLTTLNFTILGRKKDFPRQEKKSGGLRVGPYLPLSIDTLGCHLSIPQGIFYTDVDFFFEALDRVSAKRTVNVRRKNRNGKWVTVKQQEEYEVPCVSKVYSLGRKDVPMHSWCELAVDVPSDIAAPEQLYLSRIGEDGAISQSRYEIDEESGRPQVKARIRQAGRYAVRRDSVAPQLEIIKAAPRQMQLGISDADSGMKSHKVLIDGKFVPFDMDHQGRYWGNPVLYGIKSGIRHDIEITATDLCGNESKLVKQITF